MANSVKRKLANSVRANSVLANSVVVSVVTAVAAWFAN